jgi:hypothetical protein
MSGPMLAKLFFSLVLVVHIKCFILKTYLGASCYERNTYIKVSAYYEVQASKM